ncbi:MAG TPA: TIGR04053 family radical SAM/SPASM domain-containing protein, partial [Gemmatimonadales bacterium]|nr:TIGR04053 family radical SAM/SPASM domain-containing protein [Gemmatimonadales bacterium]
MTHPAIVHHPAAMQDPVTDGAAELAGTAYPGYVFTTAPRNVYWETTIACELACQHCRANAIRQRDPLELSTDEGRALMRDVRAMGSMLILTGGDPMQRPDLMDLIAYGREIGLALSITPSTTDSLKREHVARFRELGVAAMGVSLDGPTADVHDAFRGVPGTFAHSLRALGWARECKIPVQVNTTVTTATLPHLPALFRLLRDEASPPVRRWSLFLLVPVGRGAELGIPTANDVEDLFAWVYDVGRDAPFHVGTVEAPHYRRYWIQRKQAEGLPAGEVARFAKRMGFGVRDGNGVIFVSHRGDVYPAGFLPHPLLGNVRERPLSDIYRTAPALGALRNPDGFTGKCGDCEFRWACGGSRARAFAMTGDMLGSDPFCS